MRYALIQSMAHYGYRPCCQRQFKFDPFGYEFGNLNLTPHLLNITHAW